MPVYTSDELGQAAPAAAPKPVPATYVCTILPDDKGEACLRCGWPDGAVHARELKPKESKGGMGQPSFPGVGTP